MKPPLPRYYQCTDSLWLDRETGKFVRTSEVPQSVIDELEAAKKNGERPIEVDNA